MNRLVFLALSISLFGLAQPVWAHPFHICVGQMTWNAEGKLWEVSLRLHAHDLEQAMLKWKHSHMAHDFENGKPTAAELAGCRVEDPAFESEVVTYLQSQFFLRRVPKAMTEQEMKQIIEATQPSPDDCSRIAWVGKEYEKAWLWIHFEMHPPDFDQDVQRLWLCHKTLIGEVANQENSIAVERNRKNKFSLQFKEGTIVLPLAKP